MYDTHSDAVELLHCKRQRRMQSRLKNAQSETNFAMADASPNLNRDLSMCQSLSFLSDNSLPSQRARVAAKHRYLELHSEARETSPLLQSDSILDGSGQFDRQEQQVKVVSTPAVVPSPSSGYESLPSRDLRGGLGKGSIRRSSRTLRATFLQVFKSSKVFLLTSLIVACVILFAVKQEYEESFSIVSTRGAQQPECIHHHCNLVTTTTFHCCSNPSSSGELQPLYCYLLLGLPNLLCTSLHMLRNPLPIGQ